jgi:hypothetical protein
MLLRGIAARSFLPFSDWVRLDLGMGLTVVTGPNGAGKTSLALGLDLARAAVGRYTGDPAAGRLELYESAAHDGTSSFCVGVELDLDREEERRRVRAFVCAAYACGARDPGGLTAEEDDATAREYLLEDSLGPLYTGRLVIRYEAAMVRPWFVAWEFRHGDQVFHVVIEGEGSGQLRRESAEPWTQPVGAGPFSELLLNAQGLDENVMDFRVALENLKQPVSFSVQPLSGGPGMIPASLLELAPGLSVAEYGNRGFSFGQVLAAVLGAGLVLTDNRRLPLRRRFRYEELGLPADLRDGADLAAELYRLKIGAGPERDRFRQIQSTFKDLTDRDLDLRTRRAPEDGSDPGLIIEPVVVDGGRERPVEFSGAGIQEALFVSTVADEEPGRVLVLDEPAVNLGPTLQRRMLRRLRGHSQCVIITHHADLVPVEEPADLNRVVRVAPGPEGPRVLRPAFGHLAGRDAHRWLRLLGPAHVRALLFVSAVILCEGSTEVAPLSQWWRHARALGLRDPEAANIPVISVDGHTNFAAYVEYLDAFDIPWAIVADGPALRGGSRMARQLAALGHLPSAPPDDRDDFTGWREAWESVGMFTLACEFGDDGSKGGEFEALLRRVDPDLLARIRSQTGRNSKPLTGSLFAAEHPDPPEEVMDLYKKIAAWLGPEILAEEGTR